MNAATIQRVYVANSGSQDITAFELGVSGALRPLGTVPIQPAVETGRSIVMACSPDRRLLYAGYVSAESGPTVAALRIDGESGLPALVARTPLADSVAYLATDRSARYLLGASYAGGRVMVSAIGPDGVVGETLQVIVTESKAHCITTDPSNRFVLHTSLGGDLIYQQLFDAQSGMLAPNSPPTVRTPSAAGPRFLCFSPDARFVYLINELDGSLMVFPFDAARGVLGSAVQVVSMLPSGFSGKPWAADIHPTPDGRFLYASERTSSTLTHYRIDTRSGALTYAGTHPTVRQPRAFQIDAAGRLLVCSGQLANAVLVHSIDAATGSLSPLADYPVGVNPTWVEIVAAA